MATDPVTAPRETGAEGRDALLEQIAWAQGLSLISEDTRIRPDAASYVKPSEYRDIVRGVLDDVAHWLATPRPVEVTERMVERVALAAQTYGQAKAEVWPLDAMERARTTLDGALDDVRAALRAQPAGGTPNGSSVPDEIDLAYRRGVMTERAKWEREAKRIARDAQRAPVADAGERRCKDCGGSTLTVPLLPRAALNSDGVCDYCAAPTLPPVGERETVVEAQLGEWTERVRDAVFYAKAACRSQGYALTVHGSLRRDIDLVAVPWTENAVPPAELAKHVCESLVRFGVALGWDGCGEDGVEKPHGRRVWGIVLAGDPFIWLDFGVMPLASRPSPAPSGEPVAWGVRCAGKVLTGVIRHSKCKAAEWIEESAADRTACEPVPLYAAAPHPDGAA